MLSAQTITAHELRQIAVESESDPRTVREVLGGRRVRGPVDGRIRRALLRAGIVPPNPAAPELFVLETDRVCGLCGYVCREGTEARRWIGSSVAHTACAESAQVSR